MCYASVMYDIVIKGVHLSRRKLSYYKIGYSYIKCTYESVELGLNFNSSPSIQCGKS